MPRYFFHTHDGTPSIDTEGIDLGGADEARGEAVRIGYETLLKRGPRFWESGKWILRVSDEHGEIICTMTFAGEVPAQPGNIAS